jgi:hypothetical protein
MKSRLAQCTKMPIPTDQRILVMTEVCNSGEYGRSILAALNARNNN